MILNALDPAVTLNHSADIVIVGSGPAGITLARELAENCNILIIEAGGFEATTASKDSLAGSVSGLDYPLTETRARQFGGSTALWAGYCALFDSLDFEVRPWVMHSGWPIEASDLMCYYPAAAKLLHVIDTCFDSREFEAYNKQSSLQFNTKQFRPSVWRFGEPVADFAREYGKFIERAASIHTLINACVTNIHLVDNGDAVMHLDVRTLTGRTGKICAKIFILAAGGIETPRLMLASRQQCADGVGNTYGHVGRWFMEHPHVSIEGIEMKHDLEIAEWTGVAHNSDGRKFIRCLGLSPETQARNRVLNARGHLFRTPTMAENATPKLGFFFEQAPNPDCRITLKNEKDAFGLPRVHLHWEVSEFDKRSHRICGEMLAEEFVRAGNAIRTGPIYVSEDILHSNHQLGTTRMSRHPCNGVVNPNCKVHGIKNLYVAGGSVFPTVSWANPTVTVLALALRLSRHLAGNITH